jgi:outer membrane protein assembly factor BamB
VVNGIVYCGNYDKKFYALNASTGTVRWSFETGAPVYSGPCVLETNNKLNYPGTSGHQQ